MKSESFKSKKVNDEELDKDTPLSDEEVSRLIQASRETSFKRKEIKKENRLRLHSSDEILGINGHLMPSNDVVGDR